MGRVTLCSHGRATHLRYFIAVAEELNFSRAAERLHMAQPPLSAAIRQLERDLGADLFARTTREVRLTDAGRAFLRGARRTLADAERAAEDAKRAAGGELGQLQIAYSWSTRFETLPALGRAFRASHPDVELLSQEMWCPGRSTTAASTSPSRCAPRSSPSWSSPQYAASGSSRSCPRPIRSRPKTRFRSRRSPTRSSSCSRRRSHRGCTTRSSRSTVAPASSRRCGTSHSIRDGTSVS
jgi:hypothetical protein